MSQVSLSTVQGILKEFYDDQHVQWVTFKDNPTLAMLPKDTEFGGKYWPNPVMHELSSGSATFSYAYANQTAPSVAEFLVTRVADFALATIDGQMLSAAATDPAAFINSAELTIDSAFQAATNRISTALFRNGAGTIAQIQALAHVSGSGPYISTITLANPDDSVNFQVGQVLVDVQNVDGSGTQSSAAGGATITQVDGNNGILTVTSAADTTSDFTANYYLATQGDLPTTSNNNYQVVGSTTNSLLKIAGFAAWLPISVASNDSFFGVNRNINLQKLSGVSFNGSSLSLEEALLQGTGRIAMNGGRVDTAICSYATYTALIISLGSKVQYIDDKIGEIGFRGVQVNGANTVMSVYPDRSMPDGLIYCLEMDSWVLKSQGPAPHILKYMDEIELLRIPGQDATELRVGSYMNLICKRPGHNGVITVQVQEF